MMVMKHSAQHTSHKVDLFCFKKYILWSKIPMVCCNIFWLCGSL